MQEGKIGTNSKDFDGLFKGGHTIQFSECLTVEGKLRQWICKRYQFLQDMVREHKVLREHIVNALLAGVEVEGNLNAQLTPIKPKKVLDTVALEIYLNSQGRKLSDFQVEGNGGYRLNIQ